MSDSLKVGDKFPDVELPNQEGKLKRLSHFTQPSQMDRMLSFSDDYPLIVVFYRGFFCPRDNQQMRQLVQFQSELKVNYGQLITNGSPLLPEPLTEVGITLAD
jgi:peroxiredoxin